MPIHATGRRRRGWGRGCRELPILFFGLPSAFSVLARDAPIVDGLGKGGVPNEPSEGAELAAQYDPYAAAYDVEGRIVSCLKDDADEDQCVEDQCRSEDMRER
ncbi:hypothetical protein DCS_02219 [Drechmeria coniospora]|uniref:Uncharacterized protein n=1 Tax=Drechmeria coniospora TaxID=98403 RepID=A0A151GVF9_DRECN|nr:hypothetical protein DCS_02219 [Drechmeria coniospora]KYK61078.1 hypothetical protein DCS_02219 [Drechmeria coniospora]